MALATIAVAVSAIVQPASAQNTPSGGGGNRVRVIAPSRIVGPDVNSDALERIEPRPSLGASRLVPDRATDARPRSGTTRSRQMRADRQVPADGRQTLFRPVATAAGRLEADGREIHIAGVDVVEPDRNCGSGGSGLWPCGMRARTAFRYWLRGRAVECDLEDAKKAGEAEIVECDLAGEDIGAWLVSNGWALAEPEGPYADAGKAALEAGKGVFGEGRVEP